MARRPTYEELQAHIDELEHRLAERTEDGRAGMAAFISSPENLVISRLSDGMILDVSESFLETSGYRRQEIVARTILDIGIWADVEERRQFVRQLRKQGEARNLPAHFTMKDGRTLTFEISGREVEIGG